MRYFALLATFCAAAFGQTAPDQNAASELLKKRLASMDLFAQPKVLPVPKTVVCSIPLLNARPTGNYKMPVIKPPQPAGYASRELLLQVPAPACDEKLFRNFSPR